MLTPSLVALLREVAGVDVGGAGGQQADLAKLLRKDAVYNAVGLAAFDLYEEVGQSQCILLVCRVLSCLYIICEVF